MDRIRYERHKAGIMLSIQNQILNFIQELSVCVFNTKCNPIMNNAEVHNHPAVRSMQITAISLHDYEMFQNKIFLSVIK
jgi:hypothetical protein